MTGQEIESLIGCRVRIRNPSHHMYLQGHEGTIAAYFDNTAFNCAVIVDDMHNSRSVWGWYYFPFDELKILATLPDNEENNEENKGENTMAETAKAIENYTNVAKVHYLVDNSAFRTYPAANFTEDLKVGDLCVVMSKSHGQVLAEVDEILPSVETGVYREIIGVVDTSAYTERVNRRVQAAALREKMRARAKQLQDVAIYKMLAQEDPEMAQMLQEFEALK